jgi:glyoxylase-like metal-dependent hydrolase (beta-lactamase superfamily II)
MTLTQKATSSKVTQQKAIVKAFFDPETFTISYVVSDRETHKCAIIDPVLDYDAATGHTSEVSADKIISYIKAENLECEWIIETHMHADHLTSASYLSKILGAKTAIGNNIDQVQSIFGPVFNVEDDFSAQGQQFDHLFADAENFKIGNLNAKILFTPGHTPACISLLIGDICFIGDTMFMPDFGTARCDFPGGNAQQLYNSIQRILSLPDDTVLYMCHDYAPGGREYKWISSVKEEKETNIHLAGKNEKEFIKTRKARDAQLAMPKLIIPSVQVNMRAGNLPPAEDNGTSYIKIPINKL